MRKLFLLAAGVLLAAVPFGPGAGASTDAPTHNETALSLFSCAATRGGTGHPNMTVNHSHRIASKSSDGHYDWFDCEGYDHPGLDGCVWATYYIYDINPSTGQPYGIFGPFNITCFGF